jgi:dihydroneopterin aldolase
VATWSDETLAQDPAMSREVRRIFINGLELIGSVGVYEHEHRYEQRVIVSLDLRVNDGYDGASDRVSDIYDYDLAIQAIKRTVNSGHFNLIETLAERIAEVCLSDKRVVSARVRVEKPDLLPACRGIGIEILRLQSAR